MLPYCLTKKTKKKERPEEDLQKAIVRYWHFSKNSLLKKTLLQSIRNENSKGGAKGVQLGAIYKAMGRQAGFPDLFLCIEGGKVVFIELKAKGRCITKTGKQSKSLGLSEEQIAMHDFLRLLNFEVYVFWELEQFINLLSKI